MNIESEENTGLILITLGSVFIAFGSLFNLALFSSVCCFFGFMGVGVGLVIVMVGSYFMYSAGKKRKYLEWVDSIRCPKCAIPMIWWYGRYVCTHCRVRPEEDED